MTHAANAGSDIRLAFIAQGTTAGAKGKGLKVLEEEVFLFKEYLKVELNKYFSRKYNSKLHLPQADCQFLCLNIFIIITAYLIPIFIGLSPKLLKICKENI